ncbi:DNA internalization-related competence protein ComEC/Rec2 [Amphritea balenae]|uniref:DNA internalization-related competence protein ComEC/Rec2 n=1 Tax=Amphritea balenae TaxID=452629 RepID=A0A3P1SUF7_9GAMM|nr:DNA internalization-related competence protein ComEC/Rec2 [Amphritea balenae]RRD00668.1 DNA internalization-related competence protein ComEC/Rec2 [Amphritea balenae]GGK68883.1 DNA internalization-related competence protein ComEC/Rec2 [Amphritea balenae]
MIGISVGVVLVACMSSLLPGVWLVVLMLLVLLLFQAIFLIKNNFSGLLWQILGLLVGLIYASCWGYYQLAQQLPTNPQRHDVTLTGIVTEVKLDSDLLSRFVLRVERVEDAGSSVSITKAELAWYQPTSVLVPGDRWRFSVRLKPVRGFSNPGGDDYKARQLSRGIGAKGYVRGDAVLISTATAEPIARLRYQFSDWLSRLPVSSRTLATIKALLLGDKSGLTDDDWDLLRSTGTVHLVVISGMHIGIVCLLGYCLGFVLQWLISKVCCGLTDIRAIRVVLALSMALLYALLAGFTIPTQRALIMAGALLLPALLHIQLALGQRFLLALALVLLFQPLSIYQPGFWLSFGAVLVLLIALQPGTGAVRNLINAQWVVFVGLMPLLLFWVGAASVIAPLINLLAIPYLTFIMLPGTLIGAAVSAIEPGSGAIMLNSLCDLFWSSLEYSHSLAGDLEIELLPTRLPVIIAFCGALLLVLPISVDFRVFGLFLFLPLLFMASERPDKGQFNVTVIDVGQGLSVLIETETKVLLYDTGAGYRTGGSVAPYTVLPLLRHKSINHLDKLVISHADSDHAGGYPAIRHRIAIADIDTGSLVWGKKYKADACASGDFWRWDGVEFKYIQPATPWKDDENNRSCVLLVKNDRCSLIIPGDSDSGVESQVLLQYPRIEATWLVAGHHGSRFSTSVEWLQALKPESVIFSAGAGNRYGHPAHQVKSRLTGLSLSWLITFESGALILASTKNGCLTREYRAMKKRYWTAG